MMRWAPASILALGAVFTIGVDTQRTMPLRETLQATVPAVLEGLSGSDQVLSADEERVAGVSDYLLRAYGTSLSVYVGYYDRQTEGRTIHSPRNCLPGAGWEALTSSAVAIEGPSGPVTVNRYLIRKGGTQALVLYWYQGRGRVEANEYRVKVDLLRDALLRRRTEEALVRIVVPVTDTEVRAMEQGKRAAQEVLAAVARALPA